jgi:hypothetical protein
MISQEEGGNGVASIQNTEGCCIFRQEIVLVRKGTALAKLQRLLDK